jgi:hypothetical protein
MKRIRLPAAVLAAALLAATAVQVQAFPPVAHKLSDPINEFIAAAVNAGFSRMLAPAPVEINQNGTASLPVRLEYGNVYAVAAQCASNCYLRLVLKDAASGQMVQSDERLNDKPAFIFRPVWTGEYALIVELASCSTSVCQIRAVILTQPNRQPNPWQKHQ